MCGSSGERLTIGSFSLRLCAHLSRKCFHTVRTDYRSLTRADVTVLLVQRLSCCGFPASAPQPPPPPLQQPRKQLKLHHVWDLQAARGFGFNATEGSSKAESHAGAEHWQVRTCGTDPSFVTGTVQPGGCCCGSKVRVAVRISV